MKLSKKLAKLPLAEYIYRTYLSWKHLRGYQCHGYDQLASSGQLDGKTLVIVGNAGYLKEMQQGSSIDSHDVIIRMNNFRTTGYEPTLGSRTDIFLTNFYPPHIDFENPDISDVKHVVSSRPNSMRRMLPDGHRLGEHVAYGMNILPQQTVYAPDADYFERLSTKLNAYPTTGMIAIQFALDYLQQRCQKIYITGFSFFSCKSHYFSTVETTGIDHQVQNEKDLLRSQLATTKNITLDPIMAEHLDLPQLAVDHSQRHAA